MTDAEAVALVLAACERNVPREFISAWVRDDWLAEADAVLTCLRERGWVPTVTTD